MTRRKWIQSLEPPYELIEVSPDYEPDSRSVTDSVLWNDRSYDGLQATDGVSISSRTKHREYMKARGLTTADDFKDTWAKAAQDRADYYQGRKGTVTKEDIRRTIAQLENRRNR